MIARSTIIAEARDWIGTPYRHQASAKAVGSDCLGLLRGVWRAVYGQEPESAPPYTPDWADRVSAETLYDAARRHLQEISIQSATPGDVLLFRMTATAPMKHCALLDEDARIIHAYWGRAVVRSRFAPWWRARCAAAFSFPDVSPWPS